MRALNKVQIIGNVGTMEVKASNNGGNSFLTLSVATDEGYTDKSGNRVDATEWHRIVFFGKGGEMLSSMAKKGTKIFIEGKLQTRKYQDSQTGQDRYSTEIVGNEFLILANGSDREQDQGQNQAQNQNQNQNQGNFVPRQPQQNFRGNGQQPSTQGKQQNSRGYATDPFGR